MPNIYLITGIVGMLLVLGAFLANQLHMLSDDDTLYDLLNAIGSAMLVVYGASEGAWPFVILNAVWAAYSTVDVIKDLFVHARKKLP